MFNTDFIVTKDITPVRLEKLSQLVEEFNRSHKTSSMDYKESYDGSIDIKYSTSKSKRIMHFKSPRQAERFIRRTIYADTE